VVVIVEVDATVVSDSVRTVVKMVTVVEVTVVDTVVVVRGVAAVTTVGTTPTHEQALE